MADLRKFSNTSNLIRLKLVHATTGVGLTGLTEASSGLVIATIADNEAATTRYRANSSEIETISTLGTFAAPMSGKCRFKEVDATNHKGLYEFQFADARFSVSSSRRMVVSVAGAANLLDSDYEIQLTQLDPYDSVRAGLAALPAAAAEAAGGLYTRGTGAGQINQSNNGEVDTKTARMGTGVITRDAYAADTGMQSIRSGTAQAGGASTITLDAGASSVDNFYANKKIYITGGTGAGQDATIISYVGSTKVATVHVAWVTNPDNTSTFAIFPATETAAQIATAVWAAATRTLTAISDSAGVTTLLSRIPSGLFTGITSLAQWLGLMAGKQTGNSTARTEMRATGAGSGTFDETTDSQEAQRDNLGTAVGASLSADLAAVKALLPVDALTTGAVATDGSNSATSFKTNLTQTEPHHWKGAWCRITSGALLGQTRPITGYNESTKFLTVGLGGFSDVPADAVTFSLVNR